MKIKKLCSAVFSVVIAATVISAPTVQYRENIERADTQSTSILNSAVINPVPKGGNTVTHNNSDATAAVNINSSNFKKYENENDTFYEPTEESISYLADTTPYINDSLTVFFADGTAEDEKNMIVQELDGEVVGQVDFMNEYEIKIHKCEFNEINDLCEKLMENKSVEFATCSIAVESTPDYVPNDPWNFPLWHDFALSWNNPFSNWWIKATDIDKTWDYDEYFSDIDVGIVDSGVDPNHEDLENKIVFPNKFFEKNNAPTYHGNHVAGIIGATQDNEKGISGIVRDGKLIFVDWYANSEQGQSWNNACRIMTGFVNIVRNGAKVVNFSLGSSGSIDNGIDRLEIVKDIQAKQGSYYIAKMLQRGYDFICCQSAGNGVLKDNEFKYAVDASNNGTFSSITLDNAIRTVKGVTPQDIVDRIIIVASAKFNGNEQFEQSAFSNGGDQVSICAPGSTIYSLSYNTDEENPEESYAYLSGTSMAAPIVSGIASLVWSVNPAFTGAQVKHFVCDEKNTKYEVADSSSVNHLPTGTMRMVNAQLAVEAAIREAESYGTLNGHLEWERITPNKFISFTLTDQNSGTIHRLTTDSNGDFSVKIPSGEYVLKLDGKKSSFKISDGETVDIGTIKSYTPSIDLDSFSIDGWNNMQNILSKIGLY